MDEITMMTTIEEMQLEVDANAAHVDCAQARAFAQVQTMILNELKERLTRKQLQCLEDRINCLRQQQNAEVETLAQLIASGAPDWQTYNQKVVIRCTDRAILMLLSEIHAFAARQGWQPREVRDAAGATRFEIQELAFLVGGAA
ncbi:hypothetical protein [Pseudanabaena sp. PCC 6802]|uniref:hypothetical protein n=1 Tax=Pseudanabaena sp. PCC 6802 TaxID=118173 RepID=UPI000346028C|nr:hypothetical protein [Pseudanabaena sp. PCC 6802]